jgi:hypothetical protein
LVAFLTRAILILLAARAIAAPIGQRDDVDERSLCHGLVIRVCSWPPQQFRLGHVAICPVKKVLPRLVDFATLFPPLAPHASALPPSLGSTALSIDGPVRSSTRLRC